MLAGGQSSENCAGVILLVQNSRKLRGLAAEVLREHEFQVLEASNAEEAIAIFQEWSDSISLVVTDLEMPGNSGLDLANYISVRNRHLPLLFMSLHSGEVLSRLLSPARDFISKPFSPAALLEKVRQVTQNPPQGSDSQGVEALRLH
jgi:two-component system, cell cycle sensor histidine kinase and response regulator CckA